MRLSKLVSPEVRYRWRLFKHYAKLHGWWLAAKLTLGNYYVMPADRTPTYQERVANEFLREYRNFPERYKPIMNDEGEVVLRTALDEDSAFDLPDQNTSLAALSAIYGAKNLVGLGYEYPEPQPRPSWCMCNFVDCQCPEYYKKEKDNGA